MNDSFNCLWCFQSIGFSEYGLEYSDSEIYICVCMYIQIFMNDFIYIHVHCF